MLFDIKPVPKPRMTRGDKFRKPPRPEVARYWAFKQECQLKMGNRFSDLSSCEVKFRIAMPESWSMKRKAEMNLKPHTVRPDLDNLFKALADALNIEDSHIHTIRATKEWNHNAGIVIEEVDDGLVLL